MVCKLSQLSCLKKTKDTLNRKKNSHFNCKCIIKKKKSHKTRPSQLEILIKVDLGRLAQGFCLMGVKDSAKYRQVHSWSRRVSYLVTGFLNREARCPRVAGPLGLEVSTHPRGAGCRAELRELCL